MKEKTIMDNDKKFPSKWVNWLSNYADFWQLSDEIKKISESHINDIFNFIVEVQDPLNEVWNDKTNEESIRYMLSQINKLLKKYNQIAIAVGSWSMFALSDIYMNSLGDSKMLAYNLKTRLLDIHLDHSELVLFLQILKNHLKRALKTDNFPAFIEESYRELLRIADKKDKKINIRNFAVYFLVNFFEDKISNEQSLQKNLKQTRAKLIYNSQGHFLARLIRLDDAVSDTFLSISYYYSEFAKKLKEIKKLKDQFTSNQSTNKKNQEFFVSLAKLYKLIHDIKLSFNKLHESFESALELTKDIRIVPGELWDTIAEAQKRMHYLQYTLPYTLGLSSNLNELFQLTQDIEETINKSLSNFFVLQFKLSIKYEMSKVELQINTIMAKILDNKISTVDELLELVRKIQKDKIYNFIINIYNHVGVDDFRHLYIKFVAQYLNIKETDSMYLLLDSFASSNRIYQVFYDEILLDSEIKHRAANIYLNISKINKFIKDKRSATSDTTQNFIRNIYEACKYLTASDKDESRIYTVLYDNLPFINDILSYAISQNDIELAHIISRYKKNYLSLI